MGPLTLAEFNELLDKGTDERLELWPDGSVRAKPDDVTG
jgi:hypothetical protein